MARLKTLVFSLIPGIALYLVSETVLSSVNIPTFNPLPESRPPVWKNMASPWDDVRFVREQLFLGVPTLFELNFRAFLPPLEKKPGVARIVFIGDSFVFGVGNEEYQTLPRLLSAYFGYYKPDLNVEMVNLGIPGGNTQTYVQVPDTAARYQPDLVFVGFTRQRRGNYSGYGPRWFALGGRLDYHVPRHGIQQSTAQLPPST